jgi:predicted GTPase
MMHRLEVDSDLLKELIGKDLILIMGRTGSGKSTFANGLISGADSV